MVAFSLDLKRPGLEKAMRTLFYVMENKENSERTLITVFLFMKSKFFRPGQSILA